MAKTVTIPYKHRPGQRKIEKLIEKHRYFVAVCHRTFGKSYFAAYWLITSALKGPRNAEYMFIAPEKSQAKKIIWRKLLVMCENIPGIRVVEAELTIHLPNKAVVYLDGAEDPDRLRGRHVHGCVLDEVGDMSPETWFYAVSPTLQAHNAKCLMLGTPKGKNHFYDFYMNGQRKETKDLGWGSILMPVTESGVYSDEKVENLRLTYPKAVFEQEYLCQFDVVFEGYYYNSALDNIDKLGHMTAISYDPHKPVYTGWDLGLADQTAIWFSQLDDEGNFRIIDFFQDKGKDLGYYISKVKSKPYIYKTHFLPHDAGRKTITNNNSPAEFMKAHGFQCYILPKTSHVVSDISEVQQLIYRCYFSDSMEVREGLGYLRKYSAKFDRGNQKYLNSPKHDVNSDAADAFRYLTLGLAKETKKIKQSRKNIMFKQKIREDHSPRS
jgi:hypothetical protein